MKDLSCDIFMIRVNILCIQRVKEKVKMVLQGSEFSILFTTLAKRQKKIANFLFIYVADIGVPARFIKLYDKRVALTAIHLDFAPISHKTSALGQ